MSAFPPEMSPAQLPADWRERLLRALAGEGVTEPPYMPIWRLVLIDSLKLSAELLVAFLSFFAAVVLVFWIFGGDPPWAVSLLVFVGLPIIGVWFGAPPVNRVVHQLKMDFYGRNATHAVMKTRRPPIFYLRSFAFDQAASATPTFYQHLPDFAGGIFAQPTPEMALIFRVRHYAPVLAIGRPGESAPPPGAIRFHVTDARWETTVKSIVPCCEMVIWVSGNTPGLSWEIEHLVAHLPPQRLLLWPHMHLYDRWTPQERAVEWQRFVDSHSDVFPRPLPRDIDSFLYIAFDADWTPAPIPSARYPKKKKDVVAGLSGSTWGLVSFLEERFR